MEINSLLTVFCFDSVNKKSNNGIICYLWEHSADFTAALQNLNWNKICIIKKRLITLYIRPYNLFSKFIIS